jgi:Zn-dependent protease/CBS domain-containing protein
MTRAFRITRVFGIDIEVDYTWFIIFALIVLLLASRGGPLAVGVPDLGAGIRLLVAVFAALLFFVSVLLHELSHSVVALRNGLPITGITLFVFGGVSKLSDEPQTPGIEFKMAIAGPLASFVLAVVFGVLAWGVRDGAAGETFFRVFRYLAFINGLLGVFNLLPGFPLDGGRVLRAALWQWLHSLLRATRIAAGMGQGLGTLMILWGIFSLLALRSTGGLWTALVGWFLSSAAQSSYQQLMVKQTVAGVSVSSIMTRNVHSVRADATLEDIVHEQIMTHSHPAYPVFDDGRLLGILSLADIRQVPRERRPYVTAGEVVSPLKEEQTIRPEADVWEALTRMSSSNQGRLLVTEDGELRGIVSRTDVMRLIRVRMELGTS